MSLLQLQIANQLLNMMCTSYTFTSAYLGSRVSNTPKSESVSAVAALDETEMEFLLKWMKMFFESDTVDDATEKAYVHELYNLYMCIKSDYAGYLNHKKYNDSLWILSAYRQRDLTALTKKIQTDIRLFHEGMKFFTYFRQMK
jgi:hypothetical protein